MPQGNARNRNTDFSGLSQSDARRIYLAARKRVEDANKDNPAVMRRELRRLDSFPAITNLRNRAGVQGTPETETTPPRRRELVRETARRVVERERNQDSIIPLQLRDIRAGVTSGINNAFLGLPARAAAAITGTDNDLMQEYSDQQGQRAPVTNFLSTIGASLPLGGGLLGGGAAAANTLRASANPVAQTAGRALQSAGRAAAVQRGQTVRNVVRTAGGGAAIGGTTAVVKERDVAEGAGYGAVGGVAGGAAIRGGQILAGKASEVLRASGADAILRRYTSTTREELQRRLSQFRREGRAEPTMYELLDLEDRQSLQGVIGRLDRRQQNRGAELARERVEGIPGEVAQVVRNETRGQRSANVRNLASAQASSRGEATPTMPEARLAVGASDNPTRLAQLRRQEARNIMGPYDERRAVDNFTELLPTELRQGKSPGEIVEEITDPEVAAIIRAAAGSARIRTDGEGLTIREVSGMIESLKNNLNRATVIERGNIQRAIDHLEDTITERHPDVAPALARMNENWAARSRQMEGMQEIRPQANVNPNTQRNLQRSENVFETPEGGVGRAMGQRSALLDDLGAATTPALGTVRELAQSPTAARNIAQNLGQPATRNITAAARAQSESARRLATAIRDPNADTSGIEAGDLALLAAGLSPNSMDITKARSIALILDRFGRSIPENRSRTIVDMLFSRNPAMTQKAIEALRTEAGDEGMDALVSIARMTAGGVLGADAGNEDAPRTPQQQDDPLSEMETDIPAADETGPWDDFAEDSPAADEAGPWDDFAEGANPYGRRVIEEVFPQAEVTDDLRDPDSELGRANPSSYHNHTDGAVDIRPIPGMSFNEFVDTLEAKGYKVIEARDEVKNPSRHATGAHWHVVIQ